jgi:cell division protein FtsB
MLFKRNRDPRLASESLSQGFALVFLLILGGFAIAGPSGVIAWSEQQRMLEKREAELAVLAEEREQLRNRVQLLDPRHADPDLAGQLLRSQLNVAHPDEMVMLLD